MGIFTNRDNKKDIACSVERSWRMGNAQPVDGKQKRWLHFLP